MGLGSVQNSPRFGEVSVNMLTTDEGEREGGLYPPAEKYARFCNPLPPLLADMQSANRGSDPDLSDHSQGPPPMTKAIMPFCDSGSYSLDMDASSESPEGSTLSENEGSGGSGGGKYGGVADTKHSFGKGVGGRGVGIARKQREFTPQERKDELYWEKRRKNNEAARKSREKRRLHDILLENRIVDLEEANNRLREELHSLKKRYGLPLDTIFMDQHRADGVHDSPSPPVALSASAHSEGGGGGLLPRLTTFSDSPSLPPPLLAASPGAIPEMSFQKMPVSGMFLPQATHLPFFVTGLPQELHQPYTTAKHNAIAQSMLVPQAHQHNVVMTKREPEEENYQEEGMEDCRVMYSHHYGSGSSPGIAPLHIPSTVPAHCVKAESLPTRLTYDQYARSAWRTSSLSSHSSDDASDEPLQLTVHKRCSDEESHDGDSGRESISVHNVDSGKKVVNHCNNSGSSSPHSSLPLKLRHKIPSPLHHSHHPGTINTATEKSSQINCLSQMAEPDLTQACPLSLVKKEQTLDIEETSKESTTTTTSISVTNLKHLDSKYLERRRRNNEAARKCRENRRNLTRLHEAKSNYLVSENSKLREELDSLQQEMKQLRELLDQKRLEQGQGASHQQLVLSEEQTQRLKQLEEEHRLLKKEQRRLEKKQKHQRQKHDMMMNDSVDDDYDDSRDMN